MKYTKIFKLVLINYILISCCIQVNLSRAPWQILYVKICLDIFNGLYAYTCDLYSHTTAICSLSKGIVELKPNLFVLVDMEVFIS